jgi:hypothetical protein
MFIKGVFGKTHPYALTIIFMPILVWYLVRQAPFYIRKFQKYFGIFVDLDLFFSLHFVFFLSYVINQFPIIIKYKYVMQCFFFISI